MRKNQAIALRKQGKTYQAIAEALDTTKGVAWGLVNLPRYTGKGGRKTKLSPKKFNPIWDWVDVSSIYEYVFLAAKALRKEGIEVENTADYLLNWLYTRNQSQLKKITQSKRYFVGTLKKEGYRHWRHILAGRYSGSNCQEYLEDYIKHNMEEYHEGIL